MSLAPSARLKPKNSLPKKVAPVGVKLTEHELPSQLVDNVPQFCAVADGKRLDCENVAVAMDACADPLYAAAATVMAVSIPRKAFLEMADIVSYSLGVAQTICATRWECNRHAMTGN